MVVVLPDSCPFFDDCHLFFEPISYAGHIGKEQGAGDHGALHIHPPGHGTTLVIPHSYIRHESSRVFLAWIAHSWRVTSELGCMIHSP